MRTEMEKERSGDGRGDIEKEKESERERERASEGKCKNERRELLTLYFERGSEQIFPFFCLFIFPS